MKKNTPKDDLSDMRKEIVSIDSKITEMNRSITGSNGKRVNYFKLISEIKKLESRKRKLTIEAHCLENRLVEMNGKPCLVNIQTQAIRQNANQYNR